MTDKRWVVVFVGDYYDLNVTVIAENAIVAQDRAEDLLVQSYDWGSSILESTQEWHVCELEPYES